MIHEVLESAHLSQKDVKEMMEEVIKEMEIPFPTNVAPQLDLQATALRADEVEDLFIEPNVRTRISDSVAEAMKSEIRLALRAK